MLSKQWHSKNVLSPLPAPDLNSIECRQPVLQYNALQCWQPAAPPIKYGLGYRSRTLTLKLTLTLTQTLKVTIMYAVQNDTGIKFNIVLYIKVIFVGQRVGIQKAYPANANYQISDDD